LAEIAVPDSKTQIPGLNESDPYSPWKTSNGFRN
jgi:hypothetical protein